MKILRNTLALAALGALTLAPVARGADVVEMGKDTQNVKVTNESFVILDRDMTTVHFGKGADALSAGDQDALKQFVNTVGHEAKLDKLIVAAWSDQEYPTKGQELSKADHKLANERGAVIKKALKNDGAKDVTVYNMAEAPGWFAKEFNTTQSLVKGAASAKQEERSNKDALLTEIGQKLRQHGGPGTAVIIAKWKNEVVAH